MTFGYIISYQLWREGASIPYGRSSMTMEYDEKPSATQLHRESLAAIAKEERTDWVNIAITGVFQI